MVTPEISRRLETGLKVCSQCGETKGLADFHRSPISGDGRVAWCRECIKRYDRERRAQGKAPKPSAEALERRRRSPQLREARRRAQRRKLSNPLEMFKVYVRSATRAAVKAGLIQRLGCEVCRVADVQAHHTDYGRPLEVRWLCVLHHSDLHKRETLT